MPDCNLNNKAKNGECGAWATQNFGEFLTSAVDPRLTGHDGGWFGRPYDWGFGVSVQHELRPRLSVDASYNRRWWGNDTVVDNLAVGPADFDAYTVTAPVDSRLPGGGGYTITDLWAVTEAKFGATQQLRSAFRRLREKHPVLSCGGRQPPRATARCDGASGYQHRTLW